MRLYPPFAGDDLSSGLLSLLVSTLDAPPGEITIVSPWIRNVRFDLSKTGRFADAFSGVTGHVPLSLILSRLAERHEITVLLKPPHELVRFGDLFWLMRRLEERERLLRDETLKGLSVADRVIASLNASARQEERSIFRHFEALQTAWELDRKGIHVGYVDNLHAKLIVTPLAVLVGSANLTNAAMFVNREIVLEVHDKSTHEALSAAALALREAAVPAVDYPWHEHIHRANVDESRLSRWRALASRSDVLRDPRRLEDLLERLMG